MSDFDPLVRPANRTPQTGKLIEGLDTSTSLLGSGAADAPVSAGLGSVPVTGLSEALATTAGVQFKKLPPSVRLALGATAGARVRAHKPLEVRK